jgi:hypothetical protein
VLGAALLLAACGTEPDPADPPAAASPSSSAAAAPTAPDSFTLVATGDVLIHQDRALTAGARQPDGRYDFSAVLAPVAP